MVPVVGAALLIESLLLSSMVWDPSPLSISCGFTEQAGFKLDPEEQVRFGKSQRKWRPEVGPGTGHKHRGQRHVGRWQKDPEWVCVTNSLCPASSRTLHPIAAAGAFNDSWEVLLGPGVRPGLGHRTFASAAP